MKSTTIDTVRRAYTIPSLSENTFLRYFNFIALYIAQGIPEGILTFGIPAWMAMHGKSLTEIGSFVAISALPWSFKIIVAPLMDRFTYLPMGRRRPWVILGQFGLMVSFIAMAFIDYPLNNMNAFMAAGFAVGFFGAFQDVATDGMAVDIVPIKEQARANGFMWGAKIIGTSASLALGSWLLNEYSFKVCILSLSIGVSLIMLVPVFLRERSGEKLMPWTTGEASHETKKMQLVNWKEILKSIYKVFRLGNSLIIAVVSFVSMAGFNFMGTLLPSFVVKELGWTDQQYSSHYATASLIGGLAGMIIGGYLIDRYGKKSMVNIYFFVMIVMSLVFGLSREYWSAVWYITGFMIIYKLQYVFFSIGLFALSMQCCWKKVSATQFTLYMTIGNLGRIAGAKLVGPVRDYLSWEYSLCCLAVFMVIAWMIFQMLNMDHHMKKLNHLESLE